MIGVDHADQLVHPGPATGAAGAAVEQLGGLAEGVGDAGEDIRL